MRIWYQLVSSETAMTNFLGMLQTRCDAIASPGTTVEVRGTSEGVLGDQYRLFWHYDLREFIEHGLRIRKFGGYDAFVIANSLDTALVELREMLDIPVLSHMEVCCFQACTMGERFGLVVPNAKMVPRYREIPISYGLRDRLAAVEPINFANIRGFDQVFTDTALGDDCVAQVLAAARRCLAAGAEVIVAAGPHSALLASRGIYAIDDAPILDCYSLLVKAAETAVAMHRLTGTHISRRLMYQSPPPELVRRAAEVRGIDLLREVERPAG
jgi:Asp/Glu/hydantoin racemase